MLKLILLALAVWLFATIARRNKQRNEPLPPVNKTDDMVRCAICGVHLPKSESMLRGGRYFCSRAHLEQGMTE